MRPLTYGTAAFLLIGAIAVAWWLFGSITAVPQRGPTPDTATVTTALLPMCPSVPWPTGTFGPEPTFYPNYVADSTDIFVGQVVNGAPNLATPLNDPSRRTLAVYTVQVSELVKGRAPESVSLLQPLFWNPHCLGLAEPINRPLAVGDTALFFTVFDPTTGQYRLDSGAWDYIVIASDDHRTAAVATMRALVGTPVPVGHRPRRQPRAGSDEDDADEMPNTTGPASAYRRRPDSRAGP